MCTFMGNVLNNYFHNLKLRINNDEYWDFFINYDYLTPYVNDSSSIYDECLLSYIDASIDECVNDNLLIGSKAYKWEDAISVSHTMKNIGLTAMDNGLISFRRDLNNNRSFLDKYLHSTYEIHDFDTSLKLHAVSGGTNKYEYPLTVMDDMIKLNGGFYQGFFKTDCELYNILPSKLENSDTWQFEFTLKKSEHEKESDKTLNDKYQNNKGIFFYIGTRAENKWAYWYNKDDECSALSYDDYIEGGELTKYNYKINDMLDANPDFVDYDEFAMDDYMNFKYFHPSTYEYKKLEEDDFFINDYIEISSKPKIIDEDVKISRVIGWCCSLLSDDEIPLFNCCGRRIGSDYRVGTKSNISYVKTKPVCCGEHNFILSEKDVVHTDAFISKCDIFGEDYLSDIDDIEYGGDFIEEDLDISKFDFETYDGVMVAVNQYYFDTDNKFLFFDRTCDGFDVNTWNGHNTVRFVGNRNSFKDNLFLLMNRTCTGYTVHTIDSLRDQYSTQYNIYNDIINNALAFRITDDGRIGYRYLTRDCTNENRYGIKEAYSKPNLIDDDEWYNISVKLDAMNDKMRLRFYINGNLVFISSELEKLDLRYLNEIYEKQEGVAFNISIGGGTQGLADTILPNYMYDPLKAYPIEENFAGSFIGYFKSFKFYNCTVENVFLRHNTKIELKNIK